MAKKKKELTDREIFEQHPHFNIPNDEKLEQCVLGALMLEPMYITEVASIITSKDTFYNCKYGQIFDAILSLDRQGKTPDLYVVCNEVKHLGIKPIELVEMTNVVASGIKCVDHARILQQLYVGRRMIMHSINISSKAQDTTIDIADVISEASNDFDRITTCIGNDSPKHISVYVSESMNNAEERCKNFTNGISMGVPTGLIDLDKLMGGWQGGSLNVLAARPSVGKTALVLSFAKASAVNNKHVMFFSLEMKESSLTDRMLLGNGSVDRDRFKQGSMNATDWKALEKSASELEKLPITIKNKAGITLAEIKSQAILAKRKGKLDMIIIDYLQLMGMERNSTREQQVAQTSLGLKNLALQLNIPIILLCQLSRAVESRQDKTPMLSDLRESGAIEQDADNVIFIDRPSRWGLTEVEIGGTYVNAEGIAKLIVAKQRDGACDTVFIRHNDTLTQFYDYDNYLGMDFATIQPNNEFELSTEQPF